MRYGYPSLAVCDGVVEKKLVGTRGLAHRNKEMTEFTTIMPICPGMKMVWRRDIRLKGQICFVGDTGYGKEGTTGKFPPHLHFGMYEQDDWTGSEKRPSTHILLGHGKDQG